MLWAHELPLVSPSLSCGMMFLVLKQILDTSLSFGFHLLLLCSLPGRQIISFFVEYQFFGSFGRYLYHKTPRNLCVSFSRTDYRLCIYHWFLWSNSNFLLNSQWFPNPAQSYLVLYSSRANLLHSIIKWMIVSFLLVHNLHLLVCCVLSIFVLTELVLTALFCVPNRSDSVFLWGSPFLSYFSSCRVRFFLFATFNIHTDFFLPIFVFSLLLFCWYLFCLCFFLLI